MYSKMNIKCVNVVHETYLVMHIKNNNDVLIIQSVFLL